MNVSVLDVSIKDAQKALKEYRAHRGVYDKRDVEIERIYRAIARGKQVISAADAIRQAGLDPEGRPKLAICRADAERVRCEFSRDWIEFNLDWRGRQAIRVDWPGMAHRTRCQAILPRIPPQHRPSAALSNYHILWEADWTAIPRDPYLLRRIGKDAWVVLAAWDLTDVEMNVLRAHRLPQ